MEGKKHFPVLKLKVSNRTKKLQGTVGLHCSTTYCRLNTTFKETSHKVPSMEKQQNWDMPEIHSQGWESV